MGIKFILVFTLFVLSARSQSACESELMNDTLFVPEGKTINGRYLETTFKNQSSVRLFIASDNRYYMRLMVTQNFYFDKVDVLEIRSDTKSYYAKDTRQYKVNKSTGMFIIEIYRNYLATLKESGITSIVFAKAETDFTRQDANQVKKIATCIYDIGSKKK